MVDHIQAEAEVATEENTKCQKRLPIRDVT